jgi:protein-disulfide isomerase
VPTAVISLAAVVVGVALFAAGFLTHSLLDDDLDPVEEDLAVLTERVGEIQDLLGGAVGDGTPPTPAPVVAASADDDPFVGPEDASVTIIEFTDYQ